MAYRLTNTEKWGDSWFCSLKPAEKLLFIYLCDNCNLAGFIEYIPKRWASDIGIEKKGIEEGLKGIQRGIAWSKERDCVYVRNFLKHQKNYPFNEKNLAHQSIMKIFINYADKFDIQDINEFVEGGCKGVSTPTCIGNSIGDSIGSGKIVFDFSFVEEGMRVPFMDWLEYKKGKGKTYKTQKSLQACYSEMKSLSNDNPLIAIKIVNKSMANNWDGMFPLKVEQPQTYEQPKPKGARI